MSRELSIHLTSEPLELEGFRGATLHMLRTVLHFSSSVVPSPIWLRTSDFKVMRPTRATLDILRLSCSPSRLPYHSPILAHTLPDSAADERTTSVFRPSPCRRAGSLTFRFLHAELIAARLAVSISPFEMQAAGCR